MRKYLSVVFSAALFISFAHVSAMSADLVDGNCSVGLEKNELKPNRYIGAYDGHFNKTKMIMFKVKGESVRVLFNESTKWEFPKGAPATNKDDLQKKKGSCVAVDFEQKNGKQIAKAIIVLPEFKLDPKLVIKQGEVKSLMAKGAVLIDSRPLEVFINGTIPGSICIPLPMIKTEAGMKKLPADKNALIVFYCGGVHCKLSPQSAVIAIKSGYKNVKVYHEGYPDWNKNNLSEVQSAYIITELKKDNPMILIDIRKNAADIHIPGAIAIASSDIQKFRAQFPKNKNDMMKAPIIVYGADDKDENAAKEVADKITSWGYVSSSYLNGGFAAYIKANGRSDSKKLAKEIKYTAKPTGDIPSEELVNNFKKGLYKGYLFIDVTEPSEFEENPGLKSLGAVNIPLGDLEMKAPAGKDKKIIIFCASGARAKEGRDILVAKGYKNVYYHCCSVESDDKDGLKIGGKFILTGKDLKK